METKIINYTDYKHSYVHVLEPKLKLISYYTYIKKKPVTYIFKTVMNILDDSDLVYTKKEKEFIKDLRNCTTSHEIYLRIKNAIEYTRKNVFIEVDRYGEQLV